MNQTTIKESCLINGGIGLHSGKKTNIAFYPATDNHGIVFFREDKDVKIPATYKYAKSSALCTSLQKDGVTVNTVEHLLSVCNGMGIDNLLVEVQSEEIPIFDGSGNEFFAKFQKVGLKQLTSPRKIIKIIKTVTYNKGDIVIYITPADESVFTFSIDFDHSQIGAQEFSFSFNETNYANQIVMAKTFCLEKDILKMQDQGLIKGGTKKNAIILNNEGQFDNMEVMTWLNEPNLHKILDQIGDFYLADNLRIMGNIFSHKSGHAVHVEFIKYLFEECADSFVLIDQI